MANMARGKVKRIYPDESFVYIRLAGITPNVTPKDGYFRLDKNHPNYASLYSLALVAAVNRYALVVQTTGEITSLAYGEVREILIDYAGLYGTLDPTFGGGSEIVLTDLSGGNDFGRAMIAQPNGRIVVAGSVRDGQPNFGLARYLRNGTLDISFGNGGIISHSQPLANLQAQDIALQSDDKIIVVGTSTISNLADLTVARFLSGGMLDSNFNQGWVHLRFGSLPSRGSAVALQPDGKIVIAGDALDQTDYYLGLVRLHPDGSVDSTFGVADGRVTTPMTQGGGLLNVRAVAILSDGHILVAGSFTVSGHWRIFLARFTPEGALDSSFGTAGRVETAVGSDAQARDMAFQRVVRTGGTTEDRIVVIGETGSGPSSDFLLLRYDLNGSLDPSFGNLGRVITDFDGREDHADALAVAEDGSIVVAGRSQSGAASELALARYHPNGAPDAAFGTDGKVRTALQNGIGRAEDVVIQPDPASALAPFPLRLIWIYVSGWASNGNNNDFLLARYEAGLGVTRGQWIEPVLSFMMG
jgi:uncharacterized delta-60 repeat protein